MKMDFHTMKNNDTYGVRAVGRAASVLAAIAQSDGPQTLTAIAARAQLSVPTVFRLLRTLQQEGLVMPHADGGYCLGFRILEFAHALVRQLDIVVIARPHL